MTPSTGLHVIEGDATKGVGDASELVMVRLDGPPLDRVRVNITSLGNQLEFSPSMLKFDYLNYSYAQKVLVRAIDDHVDDGHFHEDKALFNATSDDECDTEKNPNPGGCNQAKPYQGISTSVAVNITDNDVCGIIVFATQLNVTLDNYGTALTSETYGVRLTSQPLSNVNIKPTGLTFFMAVSPSSLNFTSETWNVTQYFTVSASADTQRRPACEGGRRYCAAVRPREQVVYHNVTSRDLMYHNRTMASVDVSIRTVYDPLPAPRLLSAQFTDALNGLTLTFDSNTNVAGQTGNFDCSLLVNTTYSESLANQANLFGTLGATCVFTSRSVLALTFSTSPTIVSVANGFLLPLAFKYFVLSY